jgi:UDP-glucose 4-epimerase
MTDMKTILVTGGAGAIGSRLVDHLCRDNKVLILDDLSSGWHENIRHLPVKFWRGSVVDDEILREVFAEKPTVIFHLAANFANQNSVDYPQKDLQVNGLGTLKVLQYCSQLEGLERFIYTSSSCVYGNISGPIPESTREYSLDTPYAVTKLLGEQYVRFFNSHHGMPSVVLRLFNSYGPGEYPGKYRNIIPNFMYRAIQGFPLTITGTGEETRDYTFVEDTVQALLLCMDSYEAIGKTFNTGTGKEVTVRQLAELIVGRYGKQSKIVYQPRRAWDSVTSRCSDISCISKILGYSPQVPLENGLELTYRWFVDKRLMDFHAGL